MRLMGDDFRKLTPPDGNIQIIAGRVLAWDLFASHRAACIKELDPSKARCPWHNSLSLPLQLDRPVANMTVSTVQLRQPTSGLEGLATINSGSLL